MRQILRYGRRLSATSTQQILHELRGFRLADEPTAAVPAAASATSKRPIGDAEAVPVRQA